MQVKGLQLLVKNNRKYQKSCSYFCKWEKQEWLHLVLQTGKGPDSEREEGGRHPRQGEGGNVLPPGAAPAVLTCRNLHLPVFSEKDRM